MTTATPSRRFNVRYRCLHTPGQLFEELRARGFLLYRESFMWGRTDGFRHEDEHCLYVEQGELRTPEEQYHHLMAN